MINGHCTQLAVGLLYSQVSVTYIQICIRHQKLYNHTYKLYKPGANPKYADISYLIHY